ncbi:MAG: energy transducer TonB family protein [Betaproteobacteria bacterium]
MKNAVLLGGMVAALLLSACAPQTKIAAPPSKAPVPPPVALPAPAPAPEPLRPASPGVEAYKSLVASEIWTRNAEVYAEPVPEMLKSIVVLEITIDRAGNPIDLSVLRSNGFKQLELRALEAVVRAAPFPAPVAGALEGPGCVTFLETFLFRDDGRFQLRSLVL